MIATNAIQPPSPNRRWKDRDEVLENPKLHYLDKADGELKAELQARLQAFHDEREFLGWDPIEFDITKFWHHPSCASRKASRARYRTVVNRCTCEPLLMARIVDGDWCQLCHETANPSPVEFPNDPDRLVFADDQFTQPWKYEYFPFEAGAGKILTPDGRLVLEMGAPYCVHSINGSAQVSDDFETDIPRRCFDADGLTATITAAGRNEQKVVDLLWEAGDEITRYHLAIHSITRNGPIPRESGSSEVAGDTAFLQTIMLLARISKLAPAQSAKFLSIVADEAPELFEDLVDWERSLKSRIRS